ncbi:hypothetical protein ABZT02_23645 [Streptomyces sp. NPDC005402]|uniref:hypothetical protein n=1 Tax=Streptomyces sp. NPDC005402 TaxID=3155338 RepID=UPI0033ADB555
MLGLATAQPASAYAAGNSTWGVVCAFNKCIANGTLLHAVDGQGVALAYDRAQVTTAWPLCNWWVDFDYYDVTGAGYRHVQGLSHDSCTINGHVRVDYRTGPYLWKTGRACATLYSNAIRLTRQCHSIHP